MIRTRLTELLGISCPIVATGMGYVSGPGLTSAVSAAGGLGILAAATMSPTELRNAIKKVRERTGAPFGVNLRADAADAAEQVGLIIAEQVPVASFAQAPTRDFIGRLRDAGVVTIASVGARRHAEKVAAWGIDAVIAIGAEGGGHVGAVPTSLLVPQVVDAVEVPVIAAGGFFDGRGLAAALAYGATGIAMGTRFLLTSESPVADAVKQAYLASDVTGTVVTTRADGVPHRLLRTPLTERLERAGRVSGLVRSARSADAFRRASGLGWPALLREGRAMRRGTGLTWGQVLMAANTPVLLRAAMADGRPEAGLMPSGQVAGLIGDLPSCAELITRIMAEAEQRLALLGGLAAPGEARPGRRAGLTPRGRPGQPASMRTRPFPASVISRLPFGPTALAVERAGLGRHHPQAVVVDVGDQQVARRIHGGAARVEAGAGGRAAVGHRPARAGAGRRGQRIGDRADLPHRPGASDVQTAAADRYATGPRGHARGWPRAAHAAGHRGDGPGRRSVAAGPWPGGHRASGAARGRHHRRHQHRRRQHRHRTGTAVTAGEPPDVHDASPHPGLPGRP